jgi:hypothetical protein
MSQFSKDYKFFFQSPAGVEFMKFLDIALDSNHTSAENEPDNARDYMQRAKGVRQVMNYIQSVMAGKETNIT